MSALFSTSNYSFGFRDSVYIALLQASENAERRRKARKVKFIPPGMHKVPFYIGAHRKLR